MIGDLWGYLRRVLHSRAAGPSIARRGCRSAAPPLFESLEDRRLLAVNPFTFEAATSRLIISGTAVADSVLVSSTAPGILNVRFESIDGVQETSLPAANVSQVIFYGGDGNDRFENSTAVATRVLGGRGDDLLSGGIGNDELYGEDGNDVLIGGAGYDTLNGGAGDDVIVGQSGNDTLIGESGNDRLYGAEGDDILYGGSGNDTLFGGDGNDQLWGHEGDDSLYGEGGDDALYGAEGNDLLDGGAGTDTLDGGIGNDKMWGQDGNDTLDGGIGNDEMHGNGGNDVLYGSDGIDLIWGGAGDDKVWGHAGDDVLFGDAGDDELYGGDGNDTLYGGAGNDRLEGHAGDDRMFGRTGNDMLNGGDGNDEMYGEDGDDILDGGIGNDFISSGNGNNTLWGQAGDDFMLGGLHNDVMHGGDGNDRMIGGAGYDTLNGNLGDDWIWGQSGNDTLNGEEGNDFLYGMEGADVLYGGNGNDLLRGGDGDDQLWGHTGNDTIHGEDGNDQLFGAEGDDSLFGGAGADSLYGGDDNDKLWGGLGDDTVLGELGNDVLIGNEGQDFLDGGGGSDLLIGGGDIDSLNGNFDGDILIGGTTVYDADSAKLQSIMSIWTSLSPYASRIQALQDELFGARLESEETVFDDLVSDTITGAGGDDWFFLTGSMPVYDPVNEYAHALGLPHGHHGDLVVTELPELEGFEFVSALDKLTDYQTTESLHTKVPHASDFLKQKEHLTLFELVRYDQVTNFAVTDGAWSNPATWSNGVVPANGARVLIPIGIEVVVNASFSARLATVRVDGTLSFSTTANSTLRVDTMVVSGSGTFEMGTASEPIPTNVTARLLITDNGPINRDYDPFGLSRGVISHGHVSMYGAERTSHVAIVGAALAGATQIQLSVTPVGWRVGDSIALAASVAGIEQNEVRTIQSINGNLVTFSQPLLYNHQAPSVGLRVHAANLTRNAIIESEASATDRRGHVMFMHHRDVDINFAGFYGLGRTDKLTPVNDPVVDANWNLVEGTGSNPRGRYAVHFHRNGSVNDGNPSVARGSVVRDSGSWGFVNHSSYVDISDNVAFDTTGAGFVSEAGDEIGNFTRNIAIGTVGSGELTESRLYIQDFGHQGDGFWFQGAGISVTQNVSAGNDGSAYIFYTRGLIESGSAREFLSQNLSQPEIAGGAATISVQHVPIQQFQNNVGYASGVGLIVEYHLRDATHGLTGTFRDSTFWNNTTGVFLPYAQNTVLQNLVVLHSLGTYPFAGIDSNAVTRNIQYNNLTVVGYLRGIRLPVAGANVVNGGYFDNSYNFVINTANSPGRSVRINGPITFGVLAGIGQTHVIMQPLLDQFAGRSDYLYYLDTVILNYGPFVNKRAYYSLQAASAIPFPELTPDVPASYVNLTTQQIFNLNGIAVGGAIAPISAIGFPNIIGLVAQ